MCCFVTIVNIFLMSLPVAAHSFTTTHLIMVEFYQFCIYNFVIQSIKVLRVAEPYAISSD